MSKNGWYGESQRHRLARKGIKSGKKVASYKRNNDLSDDMASTAKHGIDKVEKFADSILDNNELENNKIEPNNAIIYEGNTTASVKDSKDRTIVASKEQATGRTKVVIAEKGDINMVEMNEKESHAIKSVLSPKTYQAIRTYKSGMKSVVPIGGSFTAENKTEALKLANKKYNKIQGSKIEVWEK
jgi:hypothetical protein